MAVNGKGRPTKAQTEQAKLVNEWLAHIASYEKVYQPWETRADKIIKRYRDEDRDRTRDGSAKFNILWANVQTLVPATYSRIPKPDVSRRFKDNDPVARVAAMIVERALEFEVEHYEDFRNTMRSCVLDRFLGGRGTSWARYEPHVRAVPGEPVDGDQVTEDADEPNEELDYECAPVDYVHWKDFGHTLARTWDEVRGVWRRVYMTRKALEARFGEDWAKKIPLDAQPEDYQRKETSGDGEDLSRACIYEIWDKDTGCANWLSKSLKQMVDQKDDPLGLEDFFPCPRPLYASLTNDSLVPVPDFTLYQDQARQLDMLADRLEGLIQALQVKGVYDASIPEIARIFTEGVNGTLIPVKNWQAFAEKNGLDGAVDVVDLKNIYEALRACYEAIQQCLKIIYDVTGLADIVRGQSEASETATAQQIKGQYASLRLKSLQTEVAYFASQMLQLKAQVICGQFDPQTILTMAGAEQLADQDKQLIPQALALLIGPERMQDPNAKQGPNPMRSFRIEVMSDTMVMIDEEEDKAKRLEFISALGGFFEKTLPMVQAFPESAPVAVSLLKFGVTAFKVGKTIEGVLDQAIDQLAQQAAQPKPPKQDPEMARVEAAAQAQQQKIQSDANAQQQKLESEAKFKEMEMAFEERIRIREMTWEAKIKEWEAMLQANTQIKIAEMQPAPERPQ